MVEPESPDRPLGRFLQQQAEPVRQFVSLALPYSNWGANYFEVRLMELAMADSMFGGLFSRGGNRVLDIGCGIGLASVLLSTHFDYVDGTDIDAIGVTFKIDKPAPLVGAELIEQLGLGNITLHCADTLAFLKDRKSAYDLIVSHFVLEHVPALAPLCEAMVDALRPGGQTFHIVPNTHDTVNQLLLQNLQPLWPSLKRAWRARRQTGRIDGRMQGHLFTPITHSEFIDDYRTQFEVNSSDHFLFPLLNAGLRVIDMKPMREHAYGILAEKP